MKGLRHDSKGSHKSAEDDDSAAKEDYWDEEDELEEYIMKRDLGQIKEGDGSDSSSSSEEGSCSDNVHLTYNNCHNACSTIETSIILCYE